VCHSFVVLLSNGKGSFFLLVSVFLFLSLWLSCSLTFTFLPGLLIILCFFTHLLYYLLATFSTTFFLLRYGMQGCGSVRRMEGWAGAGLGWVGSRSGGVGRNGGKGVCCDEGK
jgi:hypothetical protein